jgi:heat shock protein HslJ
MDRIILLSILALVLASSQEVGSYKMTEFVNGMTNYGGITLELTSDQFSILGGCNRLWGTYTVSDSKFTVGPVASTRIGCFPDYDIDLTKQLSNVKTFTYSNGLLTLLNDKG